jgi:hypothetical protein
MGGFEGTAGVTGLLAHVYGWSWDEYAWVVAAPVVILAILVLVMIHRSSPEEDEESVEEGVDRTPGA